MYSAYISKKKVEKGHVHESSMPIGDINGDQVMDTGEESKRTEKGQMKSGDKYVIRKLVSLKISVEHIEEYINMLKTGTPMIVNTNQVTYNNFGFGTMPQAPNMMDFNFQNNLYVPPMNNMGHARSNS